MPEGRVPASERGPRTFSCVHPMALGPQTPAPYVVYGDGASAVWQLADGPPRHNNSNNRTPSPQTPPQKDEPGSLPNHTGPPGAPRKTRPRYPRLKYTRGGSPIREDQEHARHSSLGANLPPRFQSPVSFEPQSSLIDKLRKVAVEKEAQEPSQTNRFSQGPPPAVRAAHERLNSVISAAPSSMFKAFGDGSVFEGPATAEKAGERPDVSESERVRGTLYSPNVAPVQSPHEWLFEDYKACSVEDGKHQTGDASTLQQQQEGACSCWPPLVQRPGMGAAAMCVPATLLVQDPLGEPLPTTVVGTTKGYAPPEEGPLPLTSARLAQSTTLGPAPQRSTVEEFLELLEDAEGLDDPHKAVSRACKKATFQDLADLLRPALDLYENFDDDLRVKWLLQLEKMLTQDGGQRKVLTQDGG